MSAAIELRIEELVLDGFGQVSGRRVAVIAERHLASLVARHGLPDVAQRGGDERMVAEIRLRNDAGAAEIGRAVGRAIYRRLGS